MVHEIVKDPGCGGAFESANLEDLQLLPAKRDGQLRPVLDDVLVEPVLRKGKTATIRQIIMLVCHIGSCWSDPTVCDGLKTDEKDLNSARAGGLTGRGTICFESKN